LVRVATVSLKQEEADGAVLAGPSGLLEAVAARVLVVINGHSDRGIK
jgi:hypothetical protein